jgi:hypothetical protein
MDIYASSQHNEIYLISLWRRSEKESSLWGLW